MRRGRALLGQGKLPLIKLQNASFYRVPPSSDGATALFARTSLSFPSEFNGPAAWGVVGANSTVRTDFLNVLRGSFICDPQTARTYPHLSSDEIVVKDPKLQSPQHAIHYVGFDAERGNANLRGSYLSQRYESKREKDDYTVQDLLLGKTALNADESLRNIPDTQLFESVVADFRLEKLLEMPVSNLSNGQSRRTRIAKALLLKPELLMLDSPFMGLDVHAVIHLSNVLKRYALDATPRLILSLRSDEQKPDWLDHFVMLEDDWKIVTQGNSAELQKYLTRIVKQESKQRDMKHDIFSSGVQWRHQKDAVQKVEKSATKAVRSRWKLLEDSMNLLNSLEEYSSKQFLRDYQRVYRLMDLRERPKKTMRASRDGFRRLDLPHSVSEGESPPPPAEPLIEMDGVQVTYGTRTVLGNWVALDPSLPPGLTWTVRSGERWGIFGPNGSGKTTLTALITSDHPQSYSQPIKFFGRHRLPEPGKPGISFFDLQKKIGFSSPELHAFFPKQISIRQALESAWADTPLSKVETSPDMDDRVDAVLLWFRAELCPDIGMTDLQRNELYRPMAWDPMLYTPSGNGPWVRARRAAHVQQRITTNQFLSWADDRAFGSLPFASQRLLLFLRAIIKKPDIVILDEPFSGMDPMTVLKCQSFLAHGERKAVRLIHHVQIGKRSTPFVSRSELDVFDLALIDGLEDRQALIFIAHRKEEVPGCIRKWMCLPEPGEGLPRTGVWDGPLEVDPNKWREVWDLPLIMPDRMPLSERKPLKPLRKTPDFKPRRERKVWPLAKERQFRKTVLVKRRWYEANTRRFAVEGSLRVVRRLDSELQRLRIPILMRRPDFADRREAERLLARAELGLHDAVAVSDETSAYCVSTIRMREFVRTLRRRGTYRVPRRKTFMAGRHFFGEMRDKHGIHHY